MGSQKEFFYCYSTSLFKFLKYDKNFQYICTGLHENTFVKFWQFKRTNELMDALTEYSKRFNEVVVEG